MNDKLLYFPYCNIPDNGWTIKSLLYWDRVGIIVPPSFIQNPDRHDEFTRDLLRTDLIEPVFPYEYIHNIKQFDKGFIDLVNQQEFKLDKKQKAFSKGYYFEIFVEKIGKHLLKHLVDVKIAIQQDYETYQIESRTASLLMVYLSTAIGESGNFTPATDNIENLNFSLSKYYPKQQINKYRERLLDDLIPYPIYPDLTRLRKFKDRFHAELTSFRILIEQVAVDVASTKELYQDEKYIWKVEEINDKRKKILSELKQSKFKQLLFGSICAVGAAVTGFNEDNKLSGIFAITNAIYSAFQGYDNKDKLNKDWSYLALIDKDFART